MRAAVLFFAAACCLPAADIPTTLVSEDEAEPIHSAIIRREAWTQDSVRLLRAEADKRIKEGPWTVTADRPKNIDLDVHQYYSEAPYWWPDPAGPGTPYIRRDGQVNPARFMANRYALNAMGDAVFTLGSAAFLLEDRACAQRAARVIHTWFVNPRTRMEPNLEHAQEIPGVKDDQGRGIIEGRILIRAVQGMELLAQTGYWDVRDQAAVRRWFEEYLRWLTESKPGINEQRSGNHHSSWWTAQVAAIATYVEDTRRRDKALSYYRDRIFPHQIRSGGAPREESRTRSLSFSAFNLEAFSIICRIAQVHGVDLWNLRAKNGESLATVIDSLQPYLADPRKWSREQAGEVSNDDLYFLAFAGMGMKKPEYVALYRKLEHPDTAWLALVNLLVGRWEASGHQTRH